MNNYIIYEKKECTNCLGSGIDTQGTTVSIRCAKCGGVGHTVLEAPLKEAIIALLKTDGNFNHIVHALLN